MVKKSKKPQIEFIVSLHKLKDNYQKYGVDSYEDLESLTRHYGDKPSFNDSDLLRLQYKCEREWDSLIRKICDEMIRKIEKSKKKEKVYANELKEAKSILQKVANNTLKLGEYEKIFREEIEPLKSDFDGKMEKEKGEWKRFWFGMIIGFILGVVGSLLLRFIRPT